MDWRPSRDRRRPRVAGFAGWTLGAVLAVVGGVAAGRLLLPLAIRGFVRVTEAVIDGCVWAAMSISSGMSIWSVLQRTMHIAAALMVSPLATVAVAALVVVGAAAAYGLQRMLGSEEEST